MFQNHLFLGLFSYGQLDRTPLSVLFTLWKPTSAPHVCLFVIEHKHAAIRSALRKSRVHLFTIKSIKRK